MTETRTEEDWERQLVRMVSQEEDEPEQSWKPCVNHPDTEALFQCAGCLRLFCDDCVEEKTIGGETSHFCSICGGACNSLLELKEAKSSRPREGFDTSSKVQGAPRPVQPEPPQVDRQLGTVLFMPFRGLGGLTVLGWVVLVWAAWPLGFVLFLPYASQLYARVEEGVRRIPALWHLGGGAGYVSRFFMKLIISPILPLALCYVLLLAGSESPMSAIGETSITATVMQAHPAAFGAALCILALMPLAVILLLRTGSPFTSLDPVVLWNILKQGPGRYLSLIIAMLMLAGLCFGMFLGLKQMPIGQLSVPLVAVIDPPPLRLAIPGVLGLLWWTVTMALHGRWIGWTLGEEPDEEVSSS